MEAKLARHEEVLEELSHNYCELDETQTCIMGMLELILDC